MEIVGFRELETRDGFFRLMWLLLHWKLYPEQFEQWITIDPRLRDGAIGFCAVEDDRIIGFVGVMDLATRNFEGEEELAGGVWGVSTLPSHARRGISTSLMKKAMRISRIKATGSPF
jgi:GNAT superfamily N-acetyltransferase